MAAPPADSRTDDRHLGGGSADLGDVGGFKAGEWERIDRVDNLSSSNCHWNDFYPPLAGSNADYHHQNDDPTQATKMGQNSPPRRSITKAEDCV
jgi:hypothetical protein